MSGQEWLTACQACGGRGSSGMGCAAVLPVRRGVALFANTRLQMSGSPGLPSAKCQMKA